MGNLRRDGKGTQRKIGGSVTRETRQRGPKGSVSSSLEMVTELEGNDGVAISEAAIDRDRVSHTGAA